MRSKISPGGRANPSFIEAARRAQIVKSAMETIADVGYARASLAEIAKRAEISKSVISYYFAGREDLIRQVVAEVLAAGSSFMQSQIQVETSASAMLRAYVESNVAFMRTHREHMVALVEIFNGFRSEQGKQLLDPFTVEAGLTTLESILVLGQQTREFREFATGVMAWTIRSAIDSIPPQLAANPELDLEACARELTTIFNLATRKGA